MDLRLAASETDDFDVLWFVDGRQVAVTSSNSAAVIWFTAGTHDVVAATEYEGEWHAVVRPSNAAENGQLNYVNGWSAHHKPPPSADFPWLMISLIGAVAAVAAAVAVSPKRP